MFSLFTGTPQLMASHKIHYLRSGNIYAGHKEWRLFAVALNAIVGQLYVIVILESHLQSPALFSYPEKNEQFFLWKN